LALPLLFKDDTPDWHLSGIVGSDCPTTIDSDHHGCFIESSTGTACECSQISRGLL
jgi:hypothetical protein